MKKSLKIRKSKTGFTLIELVIVIAIVIILSVVSVPIYRSYVDKAKLSEAYALLGTILTAQKSYYAENGNFLGRYQGGNWTENNKVLGIDARGNKYFTCFLSSGLGDDMLGKAFSADLKYPESLIKDGMKRLILFYCVDSGATWKEGNY